VRSEAYLRVLADEGTVRAFAEEIGPAIGTIKQTRAKTTPAGDRGGWNWQTVPVPIDMDNVDEGLRSLLLAHRWGFLAFRKIKTVADIYLELVTRFEPGEDPGGLFLSAETIQLLNEMGAAFDHDVVTTSS